MSLRWVALLLLLLAGCATPPRDLAPYELPAFDSLDALDIPHTSGLVGGGSFSGGGGFSVPMPPAGLLGVDLKDWVYADAEVCSPGADGACDGDADDRPLFEPGVEGGYGTVVVNGNRLVYEDAGCTAAGVPFDDCTGSGTGTIAELTGSSTCSEVNALIVDASDDCTADAACGGPDETYLGWIVEVPAGTWDDCRVRFRSYVTLRGNSGFAGLGSVTEFNDANLTTSGVNCQALDNELLGFQDGKSGCGVGVSMATGNPDLTAVTAIEETTFPVGTSTFSLSAANDTSHSSPGVGDWVRLTVVSPDTELPAINNETSAPGDHAPFVMARILTRTGTDPVVFTIDDSNRQDWSTAASNGRLRMQALYNVVEWFGAEKIRFETQKPIDCTTSGGAAFSMWSLSINHSANWWLDEVDVPWGLAHMKFRTTKFGTVVYSHLGEMMQNDSANWADSAEFVQNGAQPTTSSSECNATGGEYAVLFARGVSNTLMCGIAATENATTARLFHYTHDNYLCDWYQETPSPPTNDAPSYGDGIKLRGAQFDNIIERMHLKFSIYADGFWGFSGKAIALNNLIDGMTADGLLQFSGSIYTGASQFRVIDDFIIAGNLLDEGIASAANCAGAFPGGGCEAVDYEDPVDPCTGNFVATPCGGTSAGDVSYNITGDAIKTAGNAANEGAGNATCNGVANCNGSTTGDSVNDPNSATLTRGALWSGIEWPKTVVVWNEDNGTGPGTYFALTGRRWPNTTTYPCACDPLERGSMFGDDIDTGALCKGSGEIWWREAQGLTVCP